MSSAIGHAFAIGSDISSSLVGANSAARAITFLSGGNVTSSAEVNNIFHIVGSNAGSVLELIAAGLAVAGATVRLVSVYFCASYTTPSTSRDRDP